MYTKIWKIDPFNIDLTLIREAAEIIRRGGLVAFPTETVYGLGADVFNSAACRKIFEVKKRPMDNPLIIHIKDFEQLDLVSREVPEKIFKVIKRLWPGPLTVILKKSLEIPREATGGLDTVAVRSPAHPIALKLIELSHTPIAAPSANISGKPSPTKAEHVIEDFLGIIDGIIDGGETIFGIESTIINFLTDPPTLLRPGAYPVEIIEEIIGEKIYIPDFAKGLGEAERALAPGMKYRHYAPDIPMFLVESSSYDDYKLSLLTDNILKLAKDLSRSYKIVTIAATRETIDIYEREFRNNPNIKIINIGSRKNLYEIAKNIFDVLRKADKTKDSVLIVEGVEEKSLGLAIMNRLRKASSKRIVI